MRVVLLDAARDNPFARTCAKPRARPTTGLARFEPETDDTFVVYSARPGTLSEDGPGDAQRFCELRL